MHYECIELLSISDLRLKKNNIIIHFNGAICSIINGILYVIDCMDAQINIYYF